MIVDYALFDSPHGLTLSMHPLRMSKRWNHERSILMLFRFKLAPRCYGICKPASGVTRFLPQALPQMLTKSFLSWRLFPLVFARAFLFKRQCLQILFFFSQERLQLDWAFRRPFAIECTSRPSFCIGPLLRRHHYHALIVCIAAGRWRLDWRGMRIYAATFVCSAAKCGSSFFRRGSHAAGLCLQLDNLSARPHWRIHPCHGWMLDDERG